MKRRLVILFCVILSGCLPDDTNADSYKIVTGEIKGKAYYIPEVYFAQEGTKNISDQTFFIRAMYPDYSPILTSIQELREKGDWYKNVSILGLAHPKSMPISDYAESNLKHYKAFEVVGEEYGLIHQKQPEGEIQDFNDIWLEKINEKYGSYIVCGEKLNEVSVPQCSQHIKIENLLVQSNFDKRLLPEWRAIKQNTTDLINSFETEDSARKFLRSRIAFKTGGE